MMMKVGYVTGAVRQASPANPGYMTAGHISGFGWSILSTYVRCVRHEQDFRGAKADPTPHVVFVHDHESDACQCLRKDGLQTRNGTLTQ